MLTTALIVLSLVAVTVSDVRVCFVEDSPYIYSGVGEDWSYMSGSTRMTFETIFSDGFESGSSRWAEPQMPAVVLPSPAEGDTVTLTLSKTTTLTALANCRFSSTADEDYNMPAWGAIFSASTLHPGTHTFKGAVAYDGGPVVWIKQSGGAKISPTEVCD